MELEVYDSDGQAGIFIPGSMEIDAAKEIGANMGSLLGSSINISTDAGRSSPPTWGEGDTGHLAVHLEKDAHGQGTSEVRVQGIALPRKGMNSPKT